MKILTAFLLASMTVFAQAPAGNTVVSPEVHSDGKVTLRLVAPKATEASFFGDWMATGSAEKMTKDDEGVWSVTVGPVPQGMYIYHFVVDGVTMADPVNPRMKLRARTSASLLEVQGTEPAFWQPKDVPHGAVEINWQKSKVLDGDTRWIWVYTPPGYEKDAKQAVSDPVPIPRLERHRRRMDTRRQRQLHPRQPDRRAEGQADDRRDAVRTRRSLRLTSRGAGEEHGSVRRLHSEGRDAVRRVEVPGSSRAARTGRSPDCRWAAGSRSRSASVTQTYSVRSARLALRFRTTLRHGSPRY